MYSLLTVLTPSPRHLPSVVNVCEIHVRVLHHSNVEINQGVDHLVLNSRAQIGGGFS